MNKGSFVFGSLLIFVGSLILFNPKVKRAFVLGYFDLTGFNIPFGVLVIVVGLVCIWLSLATKAQPKHLICPKCQNVQTSLESETLKCVTCGIELENLKGFYDRHRDLKDKT